MGEQNPNLPDLSALAAAAVALHESFQAYLAAGFTEDQALKLIAYLIRSQQQ